MLIAKGCAEMLSLISCHYIKTVRCPFLSMDRDQEGRKFPLMARCRKTKTHVLLVGPVLL